MTLAACCFRSRSRDAAPGLIARREWIAIGLAGDSHAIAVRSTRQHATGIERGRANGLAGAQAEARVMPGTSNRVLDQESFGEWTAVVRARRADGEDLVAASSEEHGSHPRRGRAASRRRRARSTWNARREIGSFQLLLPAAHIRPEC